MATRGPNTDKITDIGVISLHITYTHTRTQNARKIITNELVFVP